jgi:Fe-S cluster assembly ATP-binding protein
MAMLEPKLAIDETDSGLDMMHLELFPMGKQTKKSDKNAIIVITHYQRLLDHIVPDFYTSFTMENRKTGGKELAHELEEKGYDWIKLEQEA